MKRSVVGFFLILCFLLSSGYREIYAQQSEENDLSFFRVHHASLITPVSANSEGKIQKADAAEIEEADEDPTSLKKHLESPYFFSTPGNLDSESLKSLRSCKPHSSLLSYKWYLVFEVFRV
ncbi:MAG TPA: hypothetical protein VFE50_11075 [Cyclobacteriaceae bacterium]|nr:hypothetical protein [Cyclobacteriaceae bacterium]